MKLSPPELFVLAKDPKTNTILIGGLGAMGLGRSWVRNLVKYQELDGYYTCIVKNCPQMWMEFILSGKRSCNCGCPISVHISDIGRCSNCGCVRFRDHKSSDEILLWYEKNDKEPL